ncbi:MAG: hypothetical protein EAZ89_07440 [Bacteroidetes bacterium]|nr:MAG: hypothetical protein EAZ89_07440 [Bacteroidota bacterium]
MFIGKRYAAQGKKKTRGLTPVGESTLALALVIPGLPSCCLYKSIRQGSFCKHSQSEWSDMLQDWLPGAYARKKKIRLRKQPDFVCEKQT